MTNRRFGSVVSVNDGQEVKRKPWSFLKRRTSSNTTVSTNPNNVQLLAKKSGSTSSSPKENLPPVPLHHNTPRSTPSKASRHSLHSPASSDKYLTGSSGNSERPDSREPSQRSQARSSPHPSDMIQAPSNPPPAIPSNGAYFPKRNVVNSAVPPASEVISQLNGHVIHQKQHLNSTNGTSVPLTPSNGKPTLPSKPLPTHNSGANLKEEDKENHANIKTTKYPQIKLQGKVGFASLPYQVVRRCQSKGFQFNLLCVGETGTGKTTLIESLFGITLDDFKPCDNELNTVELKTKECEITEGEVNVKLRVVETAGFGDQLDKDKSAKVIVDFINDQFEARLKDELMVKRNLSSFDDKRIHACLYFISPTGHGLKALDVVTMKELSKRVNVIPVIAKSDTTSKDELIRFKKKILSELKSHQIEIYQFPTDDEAVAEQNRAMNAHVPFAVVGSVDFVTKEDGSQVRARRYPWGMVEVENKEHCDFVHLRESVLRINVDSLRERTQDVLYEAYRKDRLRELKMRDGDAGPNMEKACEMRQKEFEDELRKREKQFNIDFVKRVDDKESEIKRREELLTHRRREQEAKNNLDVQTIEQQILLISEEKNRLEGRNSQRDSGKKTKK